MDSGPPSNASGSDQPPRALLPLLIGAGVAFAWARRFVQDDAYITFVYSRNLAEGLGATWFGERIEGYTNFLWMLWVALGVRLGIDPVLWTQVTGVLLFGVLLGLTDRLGRRIEGPWTGLLAVALLVINLSVVSYATGGLETMLQAVLILAALLLLDRPVALSVVSLLALMTRLDSVVLVAALGGLAAWRHRRDPKALAALALPVAVGGLLWLGWKLWYYGDPLPNTFYAKVSGFNPNGLVFLGRFVHWYALWPFLLLAVRGLRGLGLLVALVGLWSLYIVWVGGDFMEFRFLIPVAAPLFVILATLLQRHLRRVLLPVALLILIAASALHGLRFQAITPDRALDSFHALGTCYGVYETRPWSSVGERLASDLEGLNAVVAMHPVGAIPYYSRIPTVDMYGLNDRFVARHGNDLGADWIRPGHRKFAPWSYLIERGVHLVLGDIVLYDTGQLGTLATEGAVQRLLMSARPTETTLLEEPVVVGMPIGDGESVMMLLAVPDAAIAARMQERGWEVLRLIPRARAPSDPPPASSP